MIIFLSKVFTKINKNKHSTTQKKGDEENGKRNTGRNKKNERITTTTD